MNRYKVYNKKTVIVTIVICLIVMLTAGAGIGAAVYFGIEGADTHAEVIYKSGDVDIIPTGLNGTKTLADVVAAVADTVVEINCTVQTTDIYGQSTTSTGAGSGVIINENGYIITNNHVVAGASSLLVRLRNGTEYAARLVGTDAQNDIGVIKIEETFAEGEYAVFGEYDASNSPRVGDTVIAIGNPLGALGGSVSSGIISALDRQITVEGQTMTLMQTDAAINPGNSGGGLFDMNGHIIGIVNAKSTGLDVEGLGFAIPAKIASETAASLITYGYVPGRKDIGMSLLEIADVQTAYKYGVNRLGVYVSSVTGTNAVKFKSGDYIESVDGGVIESLAQFNGAVAQKSIGDTLTVAVIRNNAKLSLELTIVENRPTLS